MPRSDQSESLRLKLRDLVTRNPSPQPWTEVSKIPWDDPDFSSRMLQEHLTQDHDAASRKAPTIDAQTNWIHTKILQTKRSRILDLGCGPGLYTSRLAQLGHVCTGIDFGPASIEYARQTSDEGALGCTYTLGDIRSTTYPGNLDLIMLLFGEFNVFKRSEVLAILRRGHQALNVSGKIVLELHTRSSIQTIGESNPTWRVAEQGLFSDEPYLRLDDACWHAGHRAAVIRHYIVDVDSCDIQLFGSTMQAYSRSEYEELILEAGYSTIEWLNGWPGDREPKEFEVMVATY